MKSFSRLRWPTGVPGFQITSYVGQDFGELSRLAVLVLEIILLPWILIYPHSEFLRSRHASSIG